MIWHKIARYYHTIKPLRVEQILYRLKYRFFPFQGVASFQSTELCINEWKLVSPIFLVQSVFEDGEVSFLNRRGRIECAEDWNDENQHEKLWLYNLHYFDDLNAKGAEHRIVAQKNFMLQWIEQNPLMIGNGWEPYPISLRLVNWVKWCQRNSVYDDQIVMSIHQQADALIKQLEFHILGNHLFANAKALCFVGVFLSGGRARKYLSKGIELLKREIPEQFLADGGHFELSPMYHCILMWDLLDLYNLALASNNADLKTFSGEFHSCIVNGIKWLRIMCHPDGEISFFNDGALGIAPNKKNIEEYALLLQIDVPSAESGGLNTLSQSGYTRLEMGDAVALFDHGEIGPTYLPGHAHADNLSIEFSLGLERVFVNTGTSTYEPSLLREYQRSTLAHNTVTVDDRNSSEIWGSFRVARRASSTLEGCHESNNLLSCEASHDGFGYEFKNLIHKRRVTLTKNALTINDAVSYPMASVVAHFYLHPHVMVHRVESKRGQVELLTQSGVKINLFTDGDVEIEDSIWYPEFGCGERNKKIKVTFNGVQLETRLDWCNE